MLRTNDRSVGTCATFTATSPNATPPAPSPYASVFDAGVPGRGSSSGGFAGSGCGAGVGGFGGTVHVTAIAATSPGETLPVISA